MQTVLFHETIFGPIHSRRLGTSLGVNLSPNDGKICSFDCLYCEAGFNAQGPGTTGFPKREEVRELLRARLKGMKDAGEKLDVITFSGNGEPTMHPEFEGIIDDTIALRDEFFPDVKISVLSNATRIGRPEVDRALRKIDNNILKLDSAVDETIRLLDRPNDPGFTAERTVERLAAFGSQAIIQTMFTRGVHDGKTVDNTTDYEIDKLIEAYRRINPGSIMIYSIDRRTPEQSLRRVMPDELRRIADRITSATGLTVTTA